MILSDVRIAEAIESGDIVIEPFDPAQLGTNSYDVRLGRTLAWYKEAIIDAKVDNEVEYREIGDEGIVLVPNRLYLGITVERVGSRRYVPYLDGKSSAGRLGISVHVTAGRGDVGFLGRWTLEIFVIQAVRVYANMSVGQFIFHETHEVRTPYNVKLDAKYNNSGDRPCPSQMWRNFR